MARAPRTPEQDFTAALAAIARKHPQIDGLVWWEQDGWPDAPSQDLDAEEIPFFAEGLLHEGFRIDWRLTGPAERPAELHLFIWEDPGPPPPEPSGPVLARGHWPPAP